METQTSVDYIKAGITRTVTDTPLTMRNSPIVCRAIQRLVDYYGLPNTFKGLDLEFINNDPILRAGLKARNAMILENQRFAFTQVKKMHTRRDFDAALQEGFIGLVRACELFDSSKGFAFTTYAAQWIRQAVWKFQRSERNSIKIPQSMINLYYSSQKAARELQKVLCRTPTISELALYMERQESEIREALSIPLEVSLEETEGNTEERNTRLNLLAEDIDPDTLVIEDLRDRSYNLSSNYKEALSDGCNCDPLTSVMLLPQINKVRKGIVLDERDEQIIDAVLANL